MTEHSTEEARCPDCGHVPHGRLGFCPNLASDNDCPCISTFSTGWPEQPQPDGATSKEKTMSHPKGHTAESSQRDRRPRCCGQPMRNTNQAAGDAPEEWVCAVSTHHESPSCCSLCAGDGYLDNTDFA